MTTGDEPQRPESLSTGELVQRVMGEVTSLARTQLELVKAEARADLQAELGVAKRFGVGAIAALCALNLLLVAGVLALSLVLPAWAAGLVAAGAVAAVAAVAAVLGWRGRVRKPLRRSRHELEEDLKWTKERRT
jgi:hypothetical protein